MKFSCDAQTVQDDINEKWMNLAITFIFHAIMEDFEDLTSKQIALTGLERRIDECFAWGFDPSVLRNYQNNGVCDHILGRFGGGESLSLQEYVESRIELEVDCLKTFTTPIEADGDLARPTKLAEYKEVEQWSALKAKVKDRLLHNLNVLLVQPSNLADFISKQHHDKLEEFLEQLLQFIKGAFDVVHAPDLYGKPVLVQIDEGGLDGLSEAEFEQFKKDARLDHIDFENCLIKSNGAATASSDVDVENRMVYGSPEY